MPRTIALLTGVVVHSVARYTRTIAGIYELLQWFKKAHCTKTDRGEKSIFAFMKISTERSYENTDITIIVIHQNWVGTLLLIIVQPVSSDTLQCHALPRSTTFKQKLWDKIQFVMMPWLHKDQVLLE